MMSIPSAGIVQGVVSFAGDVLNLRDKLKNEKHEKVIRTAEAIEGITCCIENLIKAAGEKRWDEAAGFCSELSVYVRHFRTIGFEQLDEYDLMAFEMLDGMLGSASSLQAALEHDSGALQELHKAAGSLRAVSKLLRTAR